MKTLAWTLLLLVLCLGFAGRAPSPAPVALQGVLQRAEFLGPPNYGEDPKTDRIENAYYLQLPAAVTTQRGGGSEDLARVFFVQLRVPSTRLNWVKDRLGKRVRAHGLLTDAVTGHDRTPVVMDVDTIAEVKAWDW